MKVIGDLALPLALGFWSWALVFWFLRSDIVD
jgi:hypothetical protein